MSYLRYNQYRGTRDSNHVLVRPHFTQKLRNLLYLLTLLYLRKVSAEDLREVYINCDNVWRKDSEGLGDTEIPLF